MRELLTSYGITPTSTRMRVLGYLKDNTDHPTADDVLQGLTKKGEKISRATVYNTLNLFSERGLVNAIHGHDDVIHFDPVTAVHAHFQCTDCNKIIDLDMDERDLDLDELEGAEIHNVTILIKGTCGSCLNKEE